MNTVIADDRGRVKVVEPCERFCDVSKDSQGRTILRKLLPFPAEIENVPIARFKKGKEGLPVLALPKGVTVSREQIAKSIREERNNR